MNSFNWWSSIRMLGNVQVEMKTWHFTFSFAELKIVRRIGLILRVCASAFSRLAQIASQSIGPVVKLWLQSNLTHRMQFMPKNMYSTHKSSDWPLVFSFISLALSQSMWKPFKWIQMDKEDGKKVCLCIVRRISCISYSVMNISIGACLFRKNVLLVFGRKRKAWKFKFILFSGKHKFVRRLNVSTAVPCAAQYTVFFTFFWYASFYDGRCLWHTVFFYDSLSINVNEIRPTK